MSRRVIASLRDFVPIRPLTRVEALRIAELQAVRFHELLELKDGVAPDAAFAGLPRLQIEKISPLPVSGAAQWSNGRWLILLNASEPVARQRFSLAHEFKHILDHRFIDVIYQQVPDVDRAQFIEQVCDYFAGSVLVPRRWLKRTWGDGVQHPRELARRFGVSQAAITVRLDQTGIGPRPARCSRMSPDWALPPDRVAGSSGRYHRTQALIT